MESLSGGGWKTKAHTSSTQEEEKQNLFLKGRKGERKEEAIIRMHNKGGDCCASSVKFGKC